jgi:hypothetical protein
VDGLRPEQQIHQREIMNSLRGFFGPAGMRDDHFIYKTLGSLRCVEFIIYKMSRRNPACITSSI